jgi:perosamine synthetase
MGQAYKKNYRVIPYGRHWIDEEDIRAVVDVLRSDWLTTGPNVSEFEKVVADYVGAEYAVAVNSGTAALHAAMHAAGVGPGDEVILSPMTFAATANCIVFQGATPVFADVEPDTLLINPAEVASKVTERTKAIIAVDYAGQPCNYYALRKIAKRHDLILVADACHSIGAQLNGRNVGTLADLSVFSFHPVKQMTTGEGGMVVTDRLEFARSIQRFRNHGIATDHHQRLAKGTWLYEMLDLGYNYRITDIQCALGKSQLRKLPGWLKRRREIAGYYDQAFDRIFGLNRLNTRPEVTHAYHLYVLQVDSTKLEIDRDTILKKLRSRGIGANVHYIPAYLHPFYKQHYGTKPGLCAEAESAFKKVISLPIFPQLTDNDLNFVVSSLNKILVDYGKQEKGY